MKMEPKNILMAGLAVLAIILTISLSTTHSNVDAFKKLYNEQVQENKAVLAHSDSVKIENMKKDSIIKAGNAHVDSLAKQSALVQKIANQQKDSVISLKSRANAATDLTQKLILKDSVIAGQDLVIASQDSALTLKDSQIFTLHKVSLTQDSVIGSLNTVNDQLAERIRIMNEIKPPHESKILGFIPMPSRTVVGIVGVVIGVVGSKKL